MRVRTPMLLVGFGLLAGCAPSYGGLPTPGGRADDVVVVNDDRGKDERGGDEEVRGAGRLRVPRGHYPPPGACRLWFPGRPPGQQPPPTSCDRLVGQVPRGAFVLYNDREWDADYDWREHERRNRGSVPEVILQLMRGVRR